MPPSIPTEPIGSIPRPPERIDASAHERLLAAAVRATISARIGDR